MKQAMLAGALLLLSAPALAGTPTTEPTPPSIAAVSGEMTAYGAWMARVLEIIRPVQTEAGNLSAAWQDAMRSGPEGAARFRAFVQRADAAIERANAGLRALETPAFTALDLPDDLQPQSLVRDMLRINQESGTMVRSFLPVLDSISANDSRAMQSATREMMRSITILLESQIVLARASVAATPRDEAAWEAGNIQLLFFRALQRAMAGWQSVMNGGVAEGLAGDFERLARELEEHARTGSEKNQAEIARLDGEVSAMTDAGEREAAAALRRVAAVYRVTENYFGLGRDIAGALRAGAAIAGRQPLTMATMSQVIAGLAPWRPRFDEIARQESAAMAESE